MTHRSSPEGWRGSGRSSPSRSGRSGDLQRSLCTDRIRCSRHTGPRSPSRRRCRCSLPTKRKTHLSDFGAGAEFSAPAVWRVNGTHGCRRRGGPFGCGGWAGSPRHTGHTLAPRCGARSPRTRLRSSARWPRTAPGRSGSAGRGCCTRSLGGERGPRVSTQHLPPS